MFEKILYLVSEKQEDKEFVMKLARQHNSTVLLSGILHPEHRQVKTRSSTRDKMLHEDQERKEWHDIYRLEEKLKSAGVRSSVIAQEGSIDNIQMLATTTQCDLIILAASNLEDDDYKLPEDLLPNLPCPLIITNSP
ncbi:hypothetical protein CH330_02135 [candidate division WOR-3 bacterium JGI_Cruoil_03_51_56]|uniref:UspA domain-containing protein n=1 Tax=candidate division WOR-3 bacterium JGI_Cruoil_03_51_56 TaxID=1973747 RepID=A0A235BY10_UNCW3|nr:MAG: hypothetical protein CH330_02135 [candidate division WOR-3 bacterium JGI_Cruoil_03_51_56]